VDYLHAGIPANVPKLRLERLGKTTYSVLRRVVWKTLCAEDSPVFKLLSKRVPKVFDQGYFSAAIVSALANYRIGVPLIASGLAALAMKYTAEVFCEAAKLK
jgi:hypothetical protein